MSDHRVNNIAPLSRSKYADRLGEFRDFTFANRDAVELRGNWRDFFRKKIGSAFDDRLILEIGCFNADFLSRIATKHRGAAFVGLDWKCKAIYDGAARVAELGLNNIALLHARGQDVPRIFAEGEVDEIWVFHPEAVDRDADLKTRLINDQFLTDVHEILRGAASIFAFKTDQPEYYQWMLELCGNETIRNRFDVAIASPNYWNDPAAITHTVSRSFSKEVTAYESRFIRKRIPIQYLEMRKK